MRQRVKFITSEHCVEGCGPADPTTWRPLLGMDLAMREFVCRENGHTFYKVIKDHDRLEAIDLDAKYRETEKEVA